LPRDRAREIAVTTDSHPEAPRQTGRGAPDRLGEVDEPGPPPPPRAVVEAARHQRRHRRRVMLVVAAAVLVIGTPVTLAIIAAVSAPEPDVAGAADPDPDASGLEPPGLDELSGHDADWVKLLRDVDDSERAMLAFQDELAGIAERARQEESTDPLDEVRTTAADAASALAQVRSRLVERAGDGRIEEVRQAYLEHHDAWADYLDAVVEQPTLVGASGAASQWRLTINTSGATFAHQLREALRDARVDPAIRTFAHDLLRRGFEESAGAPDA
jgi:hypothetical protein